MTPVSITLGDGSTRSGHYTVKGDTMTVHFGDKAKATQLGGTPPDALAAMILGEFPKAA